MLCTFCGSRLRPEHEVFCSETCFDRDRARTFGEYARISIARGLAGAAKLWAQKAAHYARLAYSAKVRG